MCLWEEREMFLYKYFYFYRKQSIVWIPCIQNSISEYNCWLPYVVVCLNFYIIYLLYYHNSIDLIIVKLRNIFFWHSIIGDKVKKAQFVDREYINFREVSPPSSVSSLTDEGGDTSLKLIFFDLHIVVL